MQCARRFLRPPQPSLLFSFAREGPVRLPQHLQSLLSTASPRFPSLLYRKRLASLLPKKTISCFGGPGEWPYFNTLVLISGGWPDVNTLAAVPWRYVYYKRACSNYHQAAMTYKRIVLQRRPRSLTTNQTEPQHIIHLTQTPEAPCIVPTAGYPQTQITK